MSWSIINREHARQSRTHYLFIHADGRRAIADHSISNLNDPGTTDDGLLVLDASRPAELFIGKHGALAQVPVKSVSGDALICITDPLHAVQWVVDGGCSVVLDPKAEAIVRVMAPFVKPVPAEAVA